jgi:ankyrin repeat protein
VKGRTPPIAVQNGHETVVRSLLPVTVTNCNSEDGETARRHAAYASHIGIVEQLLAKDGIDDESRNSRCETLLCASVSRGQVEKIVRLLGGRDDVNPNCRCHGPTPLMMAATDGHEAIVQLLLDLRCIQVDIPGPSGWTALMYAAAYGRDSVIRLLLGRNTSVTSREEGLELAAMRGHSTAVRLLLEQGDVNDAIDSAATMAECNGHKEVVRILREAQDVSKANG